MESSADDSSFEYLGYYAPSDAAKLFAAFEAAHVGFRADFFDGTGAIGSIPAAAGGAFGQAAQVLIRIDPQRRKIVNEIHTDLFGDCLPNYRSSFFADREEVEPDDSSSSGEA
jgi:hypothetical protein